MKIEDMIKGHIDDISYSQIQLLLKVAEATKALFNADDFFEYVDAVKEALKELEA